MAGFQKFPVPRHLTTRAYWPWTPNWKGNLIMISISVTLLSLTVWRYSLIRAVILHHIKELLSWCWKLR